MAQDTVHNRTWRTLPRNVWVTALTSFFSDVSSEMILTLTPLFLANVLGVSTAVIGLIEGIAETTSSLLKVASGWLSDKLQSRKWLTVSGYGLSNLAKPFLYFTVTWPGVLAVRFADRVGKGIRTSPRDALIADSIDEGRRGIAFGVNRAADTAGAVVGLTIALLVVLATQSQALDLSRATFQVLVLLAVIPGFLSVAILAFGARDVPTKPSDPKVRHTFAALSRDFKIFLGILAVFALGNSADGFLVLRAQERGLNVAALIGMLITFNIIYAAAAGPMGALSDRIGRQRVIVFGWLTYGVLYLGFALAQTGAQIWVIYALYGLYHAATEGVAKALVADLIPPEQRGTAYGFYNATLGLMALPASLLAGVLWQGIGDWPGFGAQAPFLAGAVLALTAAILFYLWQRSRVTRL